MARVVVPNNFQGVDLVRHFRNEAIPLRETFRPNILFQVQNVALWRTSVEPSAALTPPSLQLCTFFVRLAFGSQQVCMYGTLKLEGEISQVKIQNLLPTSCAVRRSSSLSMWEVNVLLKVGNVATWDHYLQMSPDTSHNMEAVFSMVREIFGRKPGDPVKDLDVNLAIW